MSFVSRIRDDKSPNERNSNPSGDSPGSPSALGDAVRGLGLLFRAAKTAAKKLPTVDIEEVVVTSAREVGRAFENVAATLERGVRGARRGSGPSDDGKSPPPKSPDDDAGE